MCTRWILLLCLLVPSLAQGGELSLLYGRMEPSLAGETSYSYQLDFRYRIVPHFAASASYLNEGRLSDHRRDGFTVQLWGEIPLFRDRLSLGLGGGVYQFFDTQRRPGETYANVHGIAPIYSVSATLHTDSPWFFRFQANSIRPSREIDSDTFQLGIGYALGKRREAGEGGPGADEKESARGAVDEVMAFLGETVVNSYHNQKGVSSGVEFRKGIADHADWTLTWLYEGNTDIARRQSLASQFWLVGDYFDRAVGIGAGAGAFYVVDRKHVPDPDVDSQRDVGALISITARYRFSPRWFARINWNRVISGGERDNDLYMLGIGYRRGEKGGAR